MKRTFALPERAARNSLLGPITRVPDGPQRVVAVLNPAKSGFRRVRAEIQSRCREAGWEAPTILETTVELPGADQAAEAARLGADVVVVGGGDGTVREVASGLVDTGIPIGIVPLGTGNLFAYNLRMNAGDVDDNIDIALFGDQRAIDLGHARLTFANGDITDDLAFLVLAGIGRDALTVSETSDESKRRIGWLAYVGTGLRHLASEKIPMTLQPDDEDAFDVDLWCAIVGNCGSIPAAIDVIPGAILDDGYLDLLQVAPKHLGSWVPIGLKGLLHLDTDLAGLIHERVTAVTITPHVPLPVQLDGDIYHDVAMMTVGIQPGGMQVRVPMADEIETLREEDTNATE